MKKQLLSILLFLFLIPLSNAQNSWNTGEIYLKSGEVEKGLIQIPIATTLIDLSSPKVEFKQTKKDSKKKFTEEEIAKIILKNEEGKEVVFLYIPIKKNKTALLSVLQKNQKYTLYGRKVQVGNTAPMGASGMGVNSAGTLWFTNEADEYWIKGKTDKTAFRLLKSGRTMRYFKKQAEKYFKDCPQLFSLLDNKNLEIKDIPDLLEKAGYCN